MHAPLFIDGIGFWAPALPGWPQARAALRGEASPAAPAPAAPVATAARPAPALLAASERRRAPASVVVAIEVAAQALERSGHAAAWVGSVFASAHGDLAITDALCRTLAAQPLLLSPTRFHHSVHNAASGYWAIATASHAASTALAAHEHSFAAGLLEAACQCVCDARPVLLVAYDTEAQGALSSVNRSRGLLGLALLLAPQRSAASRWRVQLQVLAGADVPATPLHSAAARALADNASAPGLPLFESLASAQAGSVALTVGPAQTLMLTLTPLAAQA